MSERAEAAVLVQRGIAGTSTREWPDVASMVEALVRELPGNDTVSTMRHLAFVAGIEDACQDVREQIARGFPGR